MELFDLKDINVFPYEHRDKNILFSSPECKARIIELKPGEAMPQCEMKSIVLFYALSGEAEVAVSSEKIVLKEGSCLVSEPGLFSMMSTTGIRLLGVQITKGSLQ